MITPEIQEEEKRYLMELINPFIRLIEKTEKTSDKNNIFKEIEEQKYDESFMKNINRSIYYIPLKKIRTFLSITSYHSSSFYCF